MDFQKQNQNNLVLLDYSPSTPSPDHEFAGCPEAEEGEAIGQGNAGGAQKSGMAWHKMT